MLIPPVGDKSIRCGLNAGAATVEIWMAVEIEQSPGMAHREEVGKITRAQVEGNAKMKTKDLTAADMDAAVRTIAGSARSMGIIVEGV